MEKREREGERRQREAQLDWEGSVERRNGETEMDRETDERRERERAGMRNREGKEGGRNRRCTGGDRCTSSVLRDSWRAINRVFRGFGKPAPTLPQTWPPATPLCSGGMYFFSREKNNGINVITRRNVEIIVHLQAVSLNESE